MPQTERSMWKDMMELRAQERREDREDEMSERMAKSQAIIDFARFTKEVEKSAILSEAFETGDFTKIDKMIDMFEKISKKLSINSFAQLCQTVESTKVLSEALENGDYTVIDKIIDTAPRTRRDDSYEDRS